MSQRVESSDRDLIKRLSQHDQGALEEIYRRYSQMVYRYAYGKLGVVQEAEDITQSCFVEFIANFEKYDASKAPLGAYLVGMARNKISNFFRNRKDVGNIADVDERLLLDNQQIDAQVINKEATELIKKGINSLPEKYSEILAFAIYSGLKQQEIADYLGMPLKTVKTRFLRGLDMLKERLSAYYQKV